MLPEFPDCLTPHEPKPKLANDRYLECLIRTAALTMYHPSSTCTMGRADDPQAVVDPLLRFVTIQVLKIIILLVNFIITTNLTGELV